MLTRDQILSLNDLKTEDLAVPEWETVVKIRVLSGRERERFETSVAKDSSNNVMARLVALCLCDEAGKPILTETDATALGEKSSKALKRIFDASIKLNALSKEGVDKAEKNSEAATSDVTPTDSLPETTESTSTSS